jgi:Uma2 family endonuclease
MAITVPRYTEHDLEEVREVTTDRVELLEGEIVVTPAPALLHQTILSNLHVVFRASIHDTGQGHVYLAPVDVVLSEDTIVQPDLVVVLADRRSVLTEKRIEGTPSLVVEVISPTTGVRDIVQKREIYARYGVPEYWIVDQTLLQVTVCSDPHGGQYLSVQTAIDAVVSATIPDLATTTAEVFAMGPDLY